MKALPPKAQHEQLLANADKEKIVHHLDDGEEQAITQIAVSLARECNLFVHFSRLWQMRVSELEPRLYSERYMQNIYVNKNTLHKKLSQARTDQE